MTDLSRLERCLLPMSRRTPPVPYFYRIVGRDLAGEALAFLKKYYHMLPTPVGYLTNGIANPPEHEIQRFYSAVGESFVLTSALIARHMTVWLGQLRPAQRNSLTTAMVNTLDTLKQQGANDNIYKNAYIKFMCWFRTTLGHVLTGLGQDVPPKILFEGNISKYEVFFLWLLHQAGCDVVYVDFNAGISYDKIDPDSHFSQAFCFPVHTPPPVHFTQEAPTPVPPQPAPHPATPAPIPPQPAPRPAPLVPHTAPPASRPVSKAPWEGLADELLLNTWAGEMPFWEAVLLPCSKRPAGETRRICALFTVCFGIDERNAYRNRLFSLRRSLDASGKKWLLLDCKTPNPTAAEAAPFRPVTAKADSIHALTSQLSLNTGRVQTLLAQRAFAQAMQHSTEHDPVRLLNGGVRLACWVKRYADILFDGYRAEHQPALLYYGSITDAEITLLWVLAQMGVDVLYVCSDKQHRASFDQHFVPHSWSEILLADSALVEPFPQREERERASTSAYNASRELDLLLYTDTGMFRDRQFTRSSPITLTTTYDEVALLWKEDAQFRPSFRAESGVVYVPNLFAKICGVDKGDIELYWNNIRDMITDDVYLATSVPFVTTAAAPIQASQVASLLHAGRIDPKAVKASSLYQYQYLPDDTQDYLLEKIQALMDYDLIIDEKTNLAPVMLSVLMNLDKDLLRRVQNFDFTRHIPKFMVIDAVETMFSLAECILLAFLNLVGFDIAIFTPTGYKNLENHLRAGSFETHIAGEFFFDLTVPDLRARKKNSGSGDWLSRIFGTGK